MRARGSTARRLSIFVVCLLLVTASAPATVTAGGDDYAAEQAASTVQNLLELDGSTAELDSSELVVRLEEAPLEDVRDTEQALESHAKQTQEPVLEYVEKTPGVDVAEEFWVTNAIVLELEPGTVDEQLLVTLERIDEVEAVHENFDLSMPDPPEPKTPVDPSPAAEDDERPQTTAAIDSVNVPTVWEEYDTRGEGVRVAVLDTGIDANHPDLELYTETPDDPTYPGGWAEFDETGERVTGSTPHDTGRHGTHVSGTVAGGAASGTAVGVAPDAELLHGQVLDDDGGTFAQLVAGIEWALEANADVINLSLGSPGVYDELIEPIQHATESDVVVVAAIGNQGPETTNAPGNVFETISVGAVTNDGTVASFSGGDQLNRSDWDSPPDHWPETYTVPTVVAPGVEITSTVPGGYADKPGTSMATPHVTGIVALVLSAQPDTSPEALSAGLTDTAWKPDGEPLEQDTRYGHGIVNASAVADDLVDRDAEAATETPAVETEADGDGETTDVANDWLMAVGLIIVSLAVVTVLVTIARYRVGRP
ncbi:S8 family serine peptidase [Natrarchaeobaculum sulfurireducens]|uniref:Putative secreted peptidase n=1 Tax=Natrarchaeobaculum sulfurireducens TaxID=2044521 RepID=A0A346PS80_9EURY|nr:S8 family serine peptidase [Natrarchaeobaculum sulfurireducens]AXR77649.1 Subtilisin-like serine protease [Natrarchaeobaculum sulfurireducens]AXR82375.1 putative secreted peptidase [Natrarchaeobaculum sulfurireducens]